MKTLCYAYVLCLCSMIGSIMCQVGRIVVDLKEFEFTALFVMLVIQQGW